MRTLCKRRSTVTEVWPESSLRKHEINRRDHNNYTVTLNVRQFVWKIWLLDSITVVHFTGVRYWGPLECGSSGSLLTDSRRGELLAPHEGK